ncbi:MAG: glycine--tRNA ligase subunit beta [Oceanicaulis sp.]|uniref:glycine--tRNA ligase subunit beta n=1 Tax=unclassified Oceanicaulis TaxID=2632123 RepID=UPI000C5428B9|nr:MULTISPECIES: glycine--tRNA ligase subunit beta [unclassified Oceanicaulis]MAB68017.1 glycine--tRNA ligase subunit beta [Oceanicaulis sp.]MBC39465.1 glycine--tRNA ligase subunit beta [Oceanicaulis sp.]MBG35050.1 glycine--tRNA ligase subunit beta [Oceanicaulis sp.]HCR94504.1 glycine--tRNA ligase subunit beta [Oceanicaulis sp.]
MAQFLFEIFCEEIPARMQARAEEDLARLMSDRLKEAGLKWDSLEAFSGPRRLGLVIEGLPLKTEDVREERKGPRTDAPEKALEGFMRGAGITSLDQCKIEEGKKGSFYIAVIEKPGRDTAEVIAEAIPDILKSFPWPKSMKFGEGETAQRWVRPLRSLISLLDGQVIKTEVFGITSGDVTDGHRIHGSGPFSVTDFADYDAKLRKNGVILRRDERKQLVLDGARRVCEEAGLELIEDQGLLEEVTGLVEHPAPILGDMDPDFLDLPPEVIALTMKTHQKYFAVRDPKSGQLTSKFVVLANQDAPDGGKAIAAGNARVLSARLSDARHFWDLDRKTGLEAMASELSKVTFHEKLGTVADKVERVAKLARELAPVVGADADMAETAARLAKADLVSQMVYEFPELQGAMGRYYALDAGLDPQIADAIKDHYKPQGPSDDVPTAPVSAAVALADKLDTLVGFWAIDEKPTGSKDPFALRRAALGVIRILLDGDYRPELWAILLNARSRIDVRGSSVPSDTVEIAAQEAGKALFNDLLAFFADRLKVHLKDEGVKHDVIDAVFALGDDDLVRVTKKARALQAFMNSDDGQALLQGYRRAANILTAEEKKGFDLASARAEAVSGSDKDTDAALMIAIAKTADAAEERALIAAIEGADEVASVALTSEDFEGAMSALSQLREPVDAFFEAVVVNAEDSMVRRNRLLLLSRIRAAADQVADFSRLEG